MAKQALVGVPVDCEQDIQAAEYKVAAVGMSMKLPVPEVAATRKCNLAPAVQFGR